MPEYDAPLQIPQIHTVNINTESAGRLQEVAKANGITGMSTFFKDLVKEREKNGVFRDLRSIEIRMSSIVKESNIDKLYILIRNNKLIY